jgi:hypothetical protein
MGLILAACGFEPKAQDLLAILESDLWQNTPPYEKLMSGLAGAC